jgi:shikimate dehydrogenase
MSKPIKIAHPRPVQEKKLLLGLIGAGIQRSLAPALQEEEARHHGLRLHYQLIDLDAAGVGVEALPGLVGAARIMGFAGFNVTYPCKQSVIPLLDSLSEEAQAIGAVNTVVREGNRLVGHNTDGSGWGWGFRRAMPDADLSRVVLVGAGGAGSACADAVLRLGAKQLIIVDLEPARAATLAERLNEHFAGGRASAGTDVAAVLQGATGLIQATPVGMAKLPGMPLPEQLLRPTLWLSEIIYVPLETPLLKAARRIGCATIDGGHMNVGQAVDAFKLFTGLEADAVRMDAHFRHMVQQTSKETV